ncbi:MAG: c-type cytochrome, partial [Steroidobacteraceae bacterium]
FDAFAGLTDMQTMKLATRFAAATLLTLCFSFASSAAEPTPETAPTHAKGSAEAGAAKATTCLACHGPNGNSVNPEWPVLAGQNASYIAEQLALFKDNVRPNVLMMPTVAPLSQQDHLDLGAYFAAQAPAGLEADPSYWQAGEKLYRGGDRARGIPGCVACHGPLGRGNPAAAYPALRAQHAVYTVKQLNDYASQTRYVKDDQGKIKSDANLQARAQMMVAIAARLTPEDRRNLASYIQGMR